MEVLVNTVVVVLLQYMSVSNQHMYTLNLHNVIYQLYLNKAGGGILSVDHILSKRLIFFYPVYVGIVTDTV